MGFVWLKLNLHANPTLSRQPIFMWVRAHHTKERRVRRARESAAKASAATAVCVTRRRVRSRKPDELHALIERDVDGRGPFFELFGRQSRPGWITLRDEATKFAPPATELPND